MVVEIGWKNEKMGLEVGDLSVKMAMEVFALKCYGTLLRQLFETTRI